jgi:uncharacterized protein (TIGR02594 family)
MDNAILAIQTALRRAGFDPGELDGIWGRDTIGAVKRFQASKGLKIDGTVGVDTRAALFGAGPVPLPVKTMDPVWLAELKRFQGLTEGRGSLDNPILLRWAQSLGGFAERYYQHDSIPWCGLTIGHVVSVTLPHEVIPNNPLSALAWAKFGQAVPGNKPVKGAIAVFRRVGGGHVAILDHEEPGYCVVWGGNQGDKVSKTKVPRERLVAYRWPSSVELPTVTAVAGKSDPNIGVSKTEA